jgi:hypothetical protein
MFARSLLMATGQRQILVKIAASVRAPNIAALATAQGWDGSQLIQVTINSGVDVAALSISGIGANLLHIINNGRIGGIRGVGNGDAGGTGLYTRTPIRITNNGTMFGAGGSGGRGEGAAIAKNGSYLEATGGYGGFGAGFRDQTTVVFDASISGGSGMNVAYEGAIGGGQERPYANSAGGGAGGAMGQPGGSGSSGAGYGGSYDGGSIIPGQSGGLAGYYVDGNAYITWLVTGTRLGRVI